MSARLSFQRTDERGLFAANERAGALDQFDVKVETAPHDVRAQNAVLPGLRDGQIEPMHRQRIFGADVNDPVRGTGDVAADRHAFQQRVRIAFQLVAVHVGAGIALIGVADQVLPVPDGLSEIFEFQSGREARPTAAAQPGQLELFIHCLRRAVAQNLAQRLVSADRDIFLDVVGIDQAAVAQDDLLLTLEERHLIPGRHRRVSTAVVDLRRHMVPLFDLAQDEALGDLPSCQSIQDPADVVGLDAMEHEQWLAGKPDIDQRFLGAKPEAPGLRKLHIEAALTYGISERVVDALRPVAGPAGAHANGNARPRGQELGQAGLANGFETAFIANTCHVLGSRCSRASNSRCNACSFM